MATQEEAGHSRRLRASSIKRLLPVFGEATFSDIDQHEMQRYVDLSSHKTQATRDIAVLSSMWSWARRRGYTKLVNPRIGMDIENDERRKSEPATDEQIRAVMERGIDAELAEAIVKEVGE